MGKRVELLEERQKKKKDMKEFEMMLKGAVASDQDVEASWSAGRLTRFRFSEPGRGRRMWRVAELQDNGAIKMSDEADDSDL